MDRSELGTILDALRFTEQAFRDYNYPEPGMKQQRLDDVAKARAAVRELYDKQP